MVGHDRREAFIRHYLIHQNASRAYREAGYQDGPGTRQSAHRLLTSAYIQARVSEERQKILAALNAKVEDVVRRFRDIAFSDIANIVAYHIGACRFCHGADHEYQWKSLKEYQASRGDTFEYDGQKEMRVGKLAPDGGIGYRAHLAPHPDCPMCGGEGVGRIKFKDTRLLKDAERSVLASIEETRNGISFRFHDQIKALKELAKRIGFYEAKVNRNTNAVARLISELQSRGQIERLPLRRDQEPKM
jgi:phage terminase small subunit